MTFLKTYLAPVTKWWWLIMTAPIIAAVSAAIFVRQLPPVYQARATLLIGRAFQDPNPSSSEFYLSYQLAGEYANVALREPVRNSTKEALGIDKLPEYEATPRGAFLEISVIHTDPVFAQAVANTLAEKLIELSPASVQAANQEDQKFIQEQLKDLQVNIEKTKQQISENQEKLSTLESALEIAKTERELTALEDKLTKLQSLYTGLYSGTREAAFNTLSIFEPAALPVIPVGPNKLLIILLAAVSGLIFAVGAAYVIEFLDDTVKTAEDISRVISAPVIGTIAEMPEQKTAYVLDSPRSQIADAFRSLRTNLEFSSVDHPIKKLVLTSAEASEGKSTVAINLALVLTQAEKRVILMDADLRAPSIHYYLDIPENRGLSDVFLNRISPLDGLVTWDKDPNLRILPAGSIPPNSAELLGSRKMDQILDELSAEADILVIDGPPAFVVDSLVLSAKADGVLIVVNSGETHRSALATVSEQLKRLGANLVGVVLNRVPRSAAYYGAYYNSYYSKDGTKKEKRRKTGTRIWAFPNLSRIGKVFSFRRKPKAKGYLLTDELIPSDGLQGEPESCPDGQPLGSDEALELQGNGYGAVAEAEEATLTSLAEIQETAPSEEFAGAIADQKDGSESEEEKLPAAEPSKGAKKSRSGRPRKRAVVIAEEAIEK